MESRAGAVGPTAFVDPSNSDEHLVAGSPAIDQGETQDTVAHAGDGNPRPQDLVCDTGAYEYVANIIFADGFGGGSTSRWGLRAPH